MTSPHGCRHSSIIPFKDTTADETCRECGRRYFTNDEGMHVWSDPGEPGYELPHHPPRPPVILPDGYDLHLASMGMSVHLDPLLPAGTFVLSAHGLGPRYFDATTGAELTREEFMALPCGWKLDPDERVAVFTNRPKDL